MQTSVPLKPSNDRFDLYQTVTDKIVAAIEAGAGAFVMPWHVSAATGRPTNALTGHGYRGVNVVALWAEAVMSGCFNSAHESTPKTTSAHSHDVDHHHSLTAINSILGNTLMTVL